MTDVTSIVELLIQLIAAIVSIVLLPKLNSFIVAKVSEAKRKKLIQWSEFAAKAAEEAARAGFIGKEDKYQYALDFLEKRGITLDADDARAVLCSVCWELFNQFKDGIAGEGGAGDAGSDGLNTGDNV